MPIANPAFPKRTTPQPGAVIPVHLPQEIVRATVQETVDGDNLVVRLDVQPPMAKWHNYRFNQKVKVHREPLAPMGSKWVTKERT